MKRVLRLVFALAASAAPASESFPGLQKILTDSEWKRSGLAQLTPDQLGVIDAALIRHYHRAVAPAADAARAAATPPAPAPGATPAETAAARARFWEKFGLGKASDWRSQPPMMARVTAWRGANGFVLDNGQVWEGLEKIPYDLPGHMVTIEARPLDAFALKLNEDSAAVRVRRVK